MNRIYIGLLLCMTITVNAMKLEHNKPIIINADPFVIAVIENDIDKVNVLINQYKASYIQYPLHETITAKISPLHIAIAGGKIGFESFLTRLQNVMHECLKRLTASIVQNNVKVSEAVLKESIKKYKPSKDTIEMYALCKELAKVPRKTLHYHFDITFEKDKTLSFSFESLKIVERLLDAKHDIEQEIAPFGLTALHIAAIIGNVEGAKLLINHNARVNAKDKAGNTPLLWAIQSNNSEIVELLLKKGANLQDTNDCGETVLHMAILSKNHELLEQILALFPSVNALTTNLMSPLHYAGYNDFMQGAYTLLEHGAAKSLKNSDDLKAEEVAAYNQKAITSNLIKDYTIRSTHNFDYRSKVHDDKITALCIDERAQILFSASWDGTIKLWKNELLKTITIPGKKITALCYKPDDQTIIAGTQDGFILVFKGDYTEPFWQFENIEILRNDKEITKIEYLRGSNFIVSDQSGILRVWDMASRKLIKTIYECSNFKFRYLYFHLSSNTLHCLSDDKTYSIYDMSTIKLMEQRIANPYRIALCNKNDSLIEGFDVISEIEQPILNNHACVSISQKIFFCSKNRIKVYYLNGKFYDQIIASDERFNCIVIDKQRLLVYAGTDTGCIYVSTLIKPKTHNVSLTQFK